MTIDDGFLVVGADSLVGGGLFRALKRRGRRALASTRRRESLDEGRVYLDFETDLPFTGLVQVNVPRPVSLNSGNPLWASRTWPLSMMSIVVVTGTPHTSSSGTVSTMC